MISFLLETYRKSEQCDKEVLKDKWSDNVAVTEELPAGQQQEWCSENVNISVYTQTVIYHPTATPHYVIKSKVILLPALTHKPQLLHVVRRFQINHP